jgi:membrane protease YdiL (CAAX protease family)
LSNHRIENQTQIVAVAVVAAFFICWAPFHAQRLLAVYLSNASKEAQDHTITIYLILMYSSGILYFLSTTINPVLYHIMSNKFREAFKVSRLKKFSRRVSPVMINWRDVVTFTLVFVSLPQGTSKSSCASSRKIGEKTQQLVHHLLIIIVIMMFGK